MVVHTIVTPSANFLNEFFYLWPLKKYLVIWPMGLTFIMKTSIALFYVAKTFLSHPSFCQLTIGKVKCTMNQNTWIPSLFTFLSSLWPSEYKTYFCLFNNRLFSKLVLCRLCSFSSALPNFEFCHSFIVMTLKWHLFCCTFKIIVALCHFNKVQWSALKRPHF